MSEPNACALTFFGVARVHPQVREVWEVVWCEFHKNLEALTVLDLCFEH
jgi:hypothetical protein